MSSTNSKRRCGKCKWSAMGTCARTAARGLRRTECVDMKVESVEDDAPGERTMDSRATGNMSEGI